MVAFTPGAVLTAANLNTAFNALTIRTTTGVSDTLVLADNGGAVTFSNAAAIAVTIPLNSSVAYAVGTKIVLINLGAGVVTVAGAVGVTVNGTPLTLAQNAGATCVKTATNTWSFLPFSSGVGNAVYSDANTGTYTGFAYKTFTASGTLTVTTAGFADIVVLGGGGASTAGGGGGGGALVITGAYLPAGALTVTVGAGGTSPGPNRAVNGNTSKLGDFYYGIGGGAGGGNGGGSGGGGDSSLFEPVGGVGVSGQGFAGGGYLSASNDPRGGGGGASAVGGTPASNAAPGGNGGAGTTTTIAGTTPSGAYVAGSYAFGGGGAGASTNNTSTGGSGGGGNSVSSGVGVAGSVNTGGGGGGSRGDNVQLGAAGGSGLVIVRVAV